MAQKKPLTAKEKEILEALYLKHPGDITEGEKRTITKLEARRLKYK